MTEKPISSFPVLSEGDMIIAEGAGLMREGTAVNTELSSEPIK